MIRHLKKAHLLVYEQIFRRSNSDSSESDEAAVDDQVHSPGLNLVDSDRLPRLDNDSFDDRSFDQPASSMVNRPSNKFAK